MRDGQLIRAQCAGDVTKRAKKFLGVIPAFRFRCVWPGLLLLLLDTRSKKARRGQLHGYGQRARRLAEAGENRVAAGKSNEQSRVISAL